MSPPDKRALLLRRRQGMAKAYGRQTAKTRPGSQNIARAWPASQGTGHVRLVYPNFTVAILAQGTEWADAVDAGHLDLCRGSIPPPWRCFR